MRYSCTLTIAEGIGHREKSKIMRSYTTRTIEKCLLGMVMICLMIAMSVIDVHAADYPPVGIKVEYTQTYKADGDRTNDTFTYQIKPVDGAPAPQNSKSGVYYFDVKGVPGNKPVDGTVNLNIVFPKPGEYKYQVSAYVPNPQDGFTYDSHKYTLHVYVVNDGKGGLKADTVSGEKGYKNGVLQFAPGHASAVVPEEEARPITTPDGNGGNGNGGGGNAVLTTAPGQPAPAVEEPPKPQTPLQRIIEKATPKADPDRDYWALFNLLSTIATILIMALLLVRYFGRIDTEEDEYIIRREGKLRLLGIIPAVVSVITFILTEDIRLPMEWWDEWSLFMLIMLIASGVVCGASYLKYDTGDDDDDGADGVAAEGNPA